MDAARRSVDPMLTPRSLSRHAPVYSHRPSPSTYRSVDGMVNVRRPISIPVAQAKAEQPLKLTVARRHNPAPSYHQTAKAAAVERAGAKALKRRHRFFRAHLPNRQTALLYGMASLVFVVGMAVSLSGLHANRKVEAQVQHGQQQTEATVSDTPVVPSAAKPTPAAVTNYAVSPTMPRYLDIPKLKVHARVLSEGVTKKGELQVPWDIYDTGWYNASSQPGQQGGMLIDGHSGIGGMHGIFYKLASLAAGDQISVTRGDGQQFTYTVVRVQTVDVGDVDMAGMLVSDDTSKPGLNLITCAGEQIPGTDQLNKRVQVYAVLQ